jgi:hypothetical protein
LARENVPQDLERRVDALLGSETVLRKRREKNYDLRPLIEGLRLSPAPPAGPSVWMRLSSREGATGRPEEVLLALGIDPAGVRIHRTRLLLAEPVIE